LKKTGKAKNGNDYALQQDDASIGSGITGQMGNTGNSSGKPSGAPTLLAITPCAKKRNNSMKPISSTQGNATSVKLNASSSKQSVAPKGSDYSDSVTTAENVKNATKQITTPVAKDSKSSTSTNSSQDASSSAEFYSDNEEKGIRFTTFSPEELAKMPTVWASDLPTTNVDDEPESSTSSVLKAGSKNSTNSEKKLPDNKENNTNGKENKSGKGKSATEGSDYGLIDFSSNAVQDYQDSKDK
jgi:hypothetical protein